MSTEHKQNTEKKKPKSSQLLFRRDTSLERYRNFENEKIRQAKDNQMSAGIAILILNNQFKK